MENEAVTKEFLKEYLKQELAMLEQHLQHHARASEQRVVDTLTELIRDSQTEVLRAFYNWARPLEMRVRHVDELQVRMAAVEDRVSELERGRLGKP